jgi:kynureninase
LERLLTEEKLVGPTPPYTIITSRQPEERGAQLSIRLNTGLLETVLHVLESNGVIVDERKPDVVRVAPAPLYNTFQDVCSFCEIFRQALQAAQDGLCRSPSKALDQVATMLP